MPGITSPPCRPDINPFIRGHPSKQWSYEYSAVMLYSTVAAGGEAGNRRGRGVEEDWHYSTVLNYSSSTVGTVP